MTTREQIISALKESGAIKSDFGEVPRWVERFYAIAFEAGRVAEREPKTLKVKMECFLIDGELHWRSEYMSVLQSWIRQPHLDMVAKVPE